MYQPQFDDIIITGLYVLFMLIMFIRHQRRCQGRWGAGSFMLLSYVIYPIIGAFWYFAPELRYGEIAALSLFPFIYLAAMLYIASYPALKYDRLNITSIEQPSLIIIHAFTIIYTCCALIQIPDMVGHISEGITKIMIDTEAGSDLYRETLSLSDDNAFSGKISNLHIVIFNIFSVVVTFLFFYYLTLEKKYKWAIICLGCCIILGILNSLAMGQRTGITMSFFDIIVAYGATRYAIAEKTQKIIRYGFLIFGLALAIPFAALSLSRFSNYDGGVNASLVYYIGEAPYYFNINAMDAGGTRHGDRTCNVFKKLLGMDAPDGEKEVRSQYPDLKMDDSIFSTFVGDFVLDFGPLVTAILFIVFSCIFTISIRPNAPNQIPLHRLLLAYFAMTVCMRGGMYLFGYAFRGNLNIIAILLIYLVLAIDYHLRHKYAKQQE